MKKIDVYDFDGTIYDGDSTIDFFLYCLKKNKIILIYLPLIFIFGVLKFLHIISLTKFKEIFFMFLRSVKDTQKTLEDFWDINEKKVNTYFLDNLSHQERKIYVISASPEFLVKEILSRYKGLYVYGTLVDMKTGKITGLNCKGKEKINRLSKVLKYNKIENFYTDSMADRPLIDISNKTYLIKKGKVTIFK